MQVQVQQILERCQQVIAKARELYGLDMSGVQIRFDLRGRSAGQAYRKNGMYGVRFNRDMLMREAFEHVLNNTVPHEFAHIACFMNPNLGCNHNSGWEKVCCALGGSGATRHQEDVVYGKGTTYEYVTDRGHKVRMGDRHHRHVQNGGTLRYRRGFGNVTQSCTYSIVGVGGRTLANPIVKKGSNEPDAAEMARRAAMVEELRRRQAAAAVQTTTPAATPANSPVNRTQKPQIRNESTTVVSWRIILSAYNRKMSYADIIKILIVANNYDEMSAKKDFGINAPKVGIPESFYA